MKNHLYTIFILIFLQTFSLIIFLYKLDMHKVKQTFTLNFYDNKFKMLNSKHRHIQQILEDSSDVNKSKLHIGRR